MDSDGPIIVHMIGNAHLDPVWLWEWQRGSDEALATCRAACDLLDGVPEATFTRGEAWVYEQVRRLDMELFRRIQAHVKTGRWEVTGGWYIQADTNLPTAEALARNIEIGHAWFRRHMGIQSIPVAYLVDSFGHGAYLPGILQRAGQRYFVFMRPGPSEMRLPGSPFRWRSPDGAEVVAARLTQYLAAGPDLSGHIRAAIEAAGQGVGHVLCFYGVGDHGGGPTRAAVRWILEHREFAAGVRLEFSSVRRYFEAIEPLRDTLPVVTGELGPHAVGCYSVCGALKRDLRAAEFAVTDAEGLLKALDGPDAMCLELDAAWEAICFNQFHDVVTGSALREAIDVARREVGGAQSRAEYLLHGLLRRHSGLMDARGAVGHRLHVANRSPRRWEGLADGEVWVDWQPWQHHLEDTAGNIVPCQFAPPRSVVREGETTPPPIIRIIWPAAVGPLGVRSFRIVPGPGEWTLPGQAPRLTGCGLENGLVRASFDDRGVAQIRDLRPGAGEVLAGPLELLVLQDHSDTWGHGLAGFEGPVVERARFGPPKLIERGPLRTTVRLPGRLGQTNLALIASLARSEPVLHLAIAANYAEPLSVLKAFVPLASAVRSMQHRVAGGWIERPADGREYPLHHAVLAECDGGPVGMVLPDTFAFSAEGQSLRPTLIRNSLSAVHISKGLSAGDVEELRYRPGTDEGPHVIRLSIALGETCLDGLLDSLQRPPIVWDDFLGVSRTQRLELK